MLFIEFDRSGVRGRESCAKSKVVSLEVANDFCFCIECGDVFVDDAQGETQVFELATDDRL